MDKLKTKKTNTVITLRTQWYKTAPMERYPGTLLFSAWCCKPSTIATTSQRTKRKQKKKRVHRDSRSMSSSARSGIVTLLHTACGAGILAMPYAFKAYGLLPGFLVLVLCGVFSTTGLLLQGQVSKYVPRRQASFFSLAQITYPQLSIIFDLAIAVKCLGVGVSYMVVIGDLLPQIFSNFTSHEILLERNFHITVVMIFIVAPLCFMKRLDSLRYASMIAISAVGYLCVLVVAHFLFPSQEIKDLKGTVSLFRPKGLHTSMLSSFPIFVFAYTCHHNTFSIVNELKDNSVENVRKVVIGAMGLAVCLYIAIGGSGYGTFGDNIGGNIIMLYPHSTSTTVGRIAIVLLVMLAFPLQCHPARASINHIIHHLFEERRGGAQNGEERESNAASKNRTDESACNGNSESSRLVQSTETSIPVDELIEECSARQPKVVPLEGRKFVVITSCILIFSYALAVSVTSLARVLAVVGATGSTSISFILPGIFGYQLIGSEYENTSEMPWKTRWTKYIALALTCWGLVVMVTCLSATLLSGASH